MFWNLLKILFCAHELLVIKWSRYNAIWLLSSAFKEEIYLSIIVIVYILLKIYAWKCLPVWYDILMVNNNTNIWFRKFLKDQLQRWMFFLSELWTMCPSQSNWGSHLDSRPLPMLLHHYAIFGRTFKIAINFEPMIQLYNY